MKARGAAVAIAAVAGLMLGTFSGSFLFGGSAWNLIPWALGAIAIGFLARGFGTVALASGVYGYLLTAAFLFTANSGGGSLGQHALFALALGLVGPVCAIPLALASHATSRRTRKER
jgi:hypothetical protein